MKTLLAVPTKGRVDTIAKDTLSWLPRVALLMSKDWILAVEPQEAVLYKKFFPQWKDHLLILPENNKGLTYSLMAIKEYAISNGYDLVFKIDDDMKGWYGKERKSGNTDNAFMQGLSACEKKIDEVEYVEAFEGAKTAYLPLVGAIGFPYSNQMFEVGKEWGGAGAVADLLPHQTMGMVSASENEG